MGKSSMVDICIAIFDFTGEFFEINNQCFILFKQSTTSKVAFVQYILAGQLVSYPCDPCGKFDLCSMVPRPTCLLALALFSHALSVR